MKQPKRIGVVVLAAVIGASALAFAQNKPDSPAVTEHIEKAKSIAGREWAEPAAFFCDSPRGNARTDPEIEPTRIFDSVWALGSTSTTIYAIATSEGWVLIDAGYPDQVESVVRPQLKKAGIDESRIKYVFLGHGHVDHYGAAKYLQDKYKTRIALTAADWDLMNPPAASGRKAAEETPRTDVSLSDGQTVAIGDFSISVVTLPGHTPGSVGYIFPVKDGQKTYVAALFGGTVLVPRIAWNLDEYVNSLKKWEDATRKANVEVQLQNHPHMLNLRDKLDRLQSRTAGDTNPFVVGNAAYGRYFQMIAECTLAQRQRLRESSPAK